MTFSGVFQGFSGFFEVFRGFFRIFWAINTPQNKYFVLGAVRFCSQEVRCGTVRTRVNGSPDHGAYNLEHDICFLTKIQKTTRYTRLSRRTERLRVSASRTARSTLLPPCSNRILALYESMGVIHLHGLAGTRCEKVLGSQSLPKLPS